MTQLVEIDGVSKTFGSGKNAVHAVREVSISLAQGEVLGLVGESGSGKSTVANLLLGIETPDSGSISVEGRPIGDWLKDEPRAYREVIQAVFQYPVAALDSRKRVKWLIEEPLVVHSRGTRKQRVARVKDLMSSVQLDEELFDRFPSELSGGQAQRVNIARALALEPKVLICDEPVSALDVSVQAQILNLLLELQTSHQMSMIFISHSLAVVRHLSNRIAVMYAGTIVEGGPGRDLVDSPSHPYTELLVQAAVTGSSSREGSASTISPEGLPRTGCRFVPRCSLATEVCSDREPELEQMSQSRSIRCWHSDAVQIGSREGQ